MADLTFIYGTMESGKTTKLLQDNFNYHKHGHKVVLAKPLIDTKGGFTVVSRTNEKAMVDILLDNKASIFEISNLRKVLKSKALLVDEAQFLTAMQVKELWEVAHAYNIQVFCYGLKNDFRGVPFEGTIALLGFADKKTELTVSCECGETAIFNARKVDEKFILDGDVVAIDGVHNVSYVPLCSDCYLKKVIGKKQIRKLNSQRRKAKSILRRLFVKEKDKK